MFSPEQFACVTRSLRPERVGDHQIEHAERPRSALAK